LILCPHCGKENLPQATRCVYCGEDLEELFRIEGVEDNTALQDEPGISTADLVEALRQADSQKDEKTGAADRNGQSEAADSGDKTESEPPAGEDEQTPEWLARIRKRAQQEEDAAGELTRKGSSLDTARSEDHQGRVDQEFASWIARIRENARRENLLTPKPAADSAESEGGVPEWLRKVRELQPEAEEEEPLAEEPAPEEAELKEGQNDAAEQVRAKEGEPIKETSPDENVGESESAPEEALETEPEHEQVREHEEAAEEAQTPAETPEAEESAQAPKTPELEPVLEELGLAAASAAVELEEKPASRAELGADLLLLRRQKENAQILMNLIGEEGKGLPPAKTPREGSRGWYRFILGAFLLLVLIAVIVFVPQARPATYENPTPAVALKDALNALKNGDKVLVVQEYQAAASAEMEQVSAPVLRALEERGIALQFLTTHPNGLWLSANLMNAAEIPARETAYLAGGRLGVLTAALLADESSAMLPEGLESLENYQLILLLEDSQADIQNWIEQAGPWLGAGKLGVLASSQNAALLLPYYDAGQLAGYTAGALEGRVLAAALGQTASTGMPLRAYQAGLLVMIAVLLLGIIIKAEADSNARHQKEPEG